MGKGLSCVFPPAPLLSGSSGTICGRVFFPVCCLLSFLLLSARLLASSLALWRSISGLAILSHGSRFLSSRQHHTVLMSVASQEAMKVGSDGPPTLFSQAVMNRSSPVSHKLGVEQLVFLGGPLVPLPGNPQSQKETTVLRFSPSPEVSWLSPFRQTGTACTP